MNKKYYTDAISDETLAKMIDKTLKYEKRNKTDKIKSSVFKIIPAAAAFLLVIGLANIIPVINIGEKENGDEITPATAITIKSDNSMQEVYHFTPEFLGALEITPDENTAAFKYGGTLGIGYKNSDGETMVRLSTDGGLIWYITDDEYNSTLDPDVSAIEWLTYDEFKTWLDRNKADLNDEQIEWYESQLEDLKNDASYSIGKVIIENIEIIFVFGQSESSGDESYYISLEEQEENLALYESVMSSTLSPEEQEANLALYESVMGSMPSQEEMDSNLALYGTVMTNGSIEKVIDYNVEYYIENGYGEINEVYVYRFVPDDGGETMGFGGTTYQLLYDLVKNTFDGWIQDGKMTREEADGKLAGLSADSTRTIVNADSEGNIIK